jgi:hypothetical protein
MRPVAVVKSDPPETKEVLADAIVKLSSAARDLQNSSGLNQKAIILLLQNATGLRQGDIKKVLDALPELRRMYCR